MGNTSSLHHHLYVRFYFRSGAKSLWFESVIKKELKWKNINRVLFLSTETKRFSACCKQELAATTCDRQYTGIQSGWSRFGFDHHYTSVCFLLMPCVKTPNLRRISCQRSIFIYILPVYIESKSHIQRWITVVNQADTVHTSHQH